MTPEDEEFARIEAEIKRRQGDATTAAPVQEPVAWICNHYEEGVKNDVDYWQDDIDALPVGTPLYTTPPAQPVPVKTYSGGKPWPVAPNPWVNLTDEEMEDLWAIHSGLPLYRAIEAKLREKNT
jgi:hypothetical protein